MDYAKAFSFVFEDDKWLSKVFIGGLLILASIFVVPFFFVLGYSEAVARKAMVGEDGLPEWADWGDLLKKGFSLAVSLFVYALPIFLLLIPMFLTTFLAGAGSDAGISDASAGIVFLVMSITILFYFAYSLFLYLLVPAINTQFIRTESIGDAIRLRDLFSIVKNNIGNVLMLIVFIMVTGIVAQIGIIACFIGVVFTTFYAQLVMYNLYGQFAKILDEEVAVPVQPKEI